MDENLNSLRAYTIVASFVVDAMDTCVSLEFAVFVSGNWPAKAIFPVLRNLPGNNMTYVTDPIGDLLTRMRNAQKARHSECCIPWSRMKEQLCEILRDNGWINDIIVSGDDPHKEMTVSFVPDKPTLELKRISKPGRRVYQNVSELKPVLRGFGMAIITTSQGLLTDKEAREKKIGGEVLCTVS
jgi:small subunit ribosomal protein S8|tara:strand:- start:7 stop:558 length:552 start_codon:yes stop_codon:yes gene_type:complete